MLEVYMRSTRHHVSTNKHLAKSSPFAFLIKNIINTSIYQT